MGEERIRGDLAVVVAAVREGPASMVAQTSEARVGLGDPAIYLEWSRIMQAVAAVVAITTRREQAE
jgi:hypothetical protein